jgi:hypothetical protein
MSRMIYFWWALMVCVLMATPVNAQTSDSPLRLASITCTDDLTGGLQCTDGERFFAVTNPMGQAQAEHADPWWFWALVGGYVACVTADATTSAYVFGAEKGYERNVLYRDVQHHPLRFGLRRAGVSFIPGAFALWLHKKGGKIGRVLSDVVLGAGAATACGWAVVNNGRLK